MKLIIQSRQTLQNIPSASGIEIIDNSIYVIGDNSPWLFMLDDKYEVKNKWQIAPTDHLVNKQIPKPLKPDLEAMTTITWDSDKGLLLFGSGSKSPERDVLIWVNIDKQHKRKTYSLELFYKKLREAAKLGKDELNIEAAVATDEKLYLFNRGKNIIIAYELKGFLEHLNGKGDELEPTIAYFTLPQINGIEAGFSGATINKNEIVFTASVENTTNWIDDGEVLGSFVGVMNINDPEKDLIPFCVPLTENGKAIKIKIEAVAVLSSGEKNNLKLLLVSDSDGGDSELIKAKLSY